MSADVVVVGAGIAGLSAALAMADAGARVHVCDAGAVAGAASGVATSYLEPRLGQTHMRTLEWQSLAAWEAYAAMLEARSGRSVGFRREGELKVATPETQAAFDKDMAKRAAQDWPLERLTGDEARELEPALSPAITEAALLPQVRWVDGAAVCAAIAAILRANGHTVTEHDAVTSLDGSTVVLASGERIAADRIMLANGLGARAIRGVPEDIPESRPVRGVNLILDQSGLDRPIRHLVKHHRGNMCPRGDTLIVGTTYEPGEASLDPAPDVIEKLYANAEPVLPILRDLPFIAIRAGLRTKVGDGNLNLGRSAQNPCVYWSLSHAGAGYLRAPIVAPEFAHFVLHGERGAMTGICTRG